MALPPFMPSHPYSHQPKCPRTLLDPYLPSPSLTTLLQALPSSFPHDFCVRLAQVHQGLNALRGLSKEKALR